MAAKSKRVPGRCLTYETALNSKVYDARKKEDQMATWHERCVYHLWDFDAAPVSRGSASPIAVATALEQAYPYAVFLQRCLGAEGNCTYFCAIENIFI